MTMALGASACASDGPTFATVPPPEVARTDAPAAETTIATSATVATSATSATTPLPSTGPDASTGEVATTETEATETEATETEATEGTSAATTSATAPNGFALSPEGPWTLVDSAPGVTTPGLVYQLLPKLWAFFPTVEADDDDPALFVPSPADRDILEAYLRAKAVFFRATSQRPIDLDDPGWAETYTEHGVDSYRRVLLPRRQSDQIADMEAGVVLRPYVMGDNRTATTAIVLDCELDGAVWRYPDGSLGPDSVPGVVSSPYATQMIDDSAGWRADAVDTQELACG